MAHHVVHHVEIHPNYTHEGKADGHQVQIHYVGGKAMEKSGPHELGKAVQRAHQALAGHEEAYEAQSAGAGIAGVPTPVKKVYSA